MKKYGFGFTSAVVGLSCLLLAEFSGASETTAKGTKSPISLQDFAFLKGTWAGKGESGAYVEESWSAPKDDSIVGHCRFIKNSKTTFYELLAVVDTPSGIVLRMRHCDGEFVPWENKEEAGDLVITSCEKGNEVVFDNMNKVHRVKVIYRKIDAHTLSAIVEDTKNGKKSKFPFVYTRLTN